MVARTSVHVTPRSDRNEIVGWRGGELSVRVSAPPDGGKANVAVCKLIAKTIGVPKSDVSVVRGEASRHKQIEVRGVDASALRAAFGEPSEEDV